MNGKRCDDKDIILNPRIKFSEVYEKYKENSMTKVWNV